MRRIKMSRNQYVVILNNFIWMKGSADCGKMRHSMCTINVISCLWHWVSRYGFYQNIESRFSQENFHFLFLFILRVCGSFCCLFSERGWVILSDLIFLLSFIFHYFCLSISSLIVLYWSLYLIFYLLRNTMFLIH
jgi:hypothetical protein